MNSPLRFTVVCSFLLFASSTSPQEPGVVPKQDNLYAQALFSSMAQMDKEWGRHKDAAPEGSIRTDYHHMIVKKSEMTENLPDRAGDYQIEILDPRDLVERYRQLRKTFAILILHPIKNQGATLTVSIGVFWFSHKKTSSSYSFSDSSNVEFRYDCQQQQWAVSKVRLGGLSQ